MIQLLFPCLILLGLMFVLQPIKPSQLIVQTRNTTKLLEIKNLTSLCEQLQ